MASKATKASTAGPDVPRGVGHFTCEDCGQEFVHGGRYAKHALHCKGKPATSGRIAAREAELRRTPPRGQEAAREALRAA